MENIQFPWLPRCWGQAGGDGAGLCSADSSVQSQRCPCSSRDRGRNVAELVTVTSLQPSVPLPSRSPPCSPPCLLVCAARLGALVLNRLLHHGAAMGVLLLFLLGELAGAVVPG